MGLALGEFLGDVIKGNRDLSGESYGEFFLNKKFGSDVAKAANLSNSAGSFENWENLFNKVLDQYKALQAEERSYNEAQAQKSFDMSMDAANTAHQREVQDLIAAGLNPWLSVQGSGASSPNAAVVSSSSASGSINSSTSLMNMLNNVVLSNAANSRAWISTLGSIMSKLVNLVS